MEVAQAVLPCQEQAEQDPYRAALQRKVADAMLPVNSEPADFLRIQ